MANQNYKLGVLAIAISLSSVAHIQPVYGFEKASGSDILGKRVYVASCKVPNVTWLGYDPARTKELYLSRVSGGLPGRDFIASNDLSLGDTNSTSAGTVEVLPIYPLNTPLEFMIKVDTGNSFYTGPSSSNPDNRAHAEVQNEWIPFTTLVSFEDDSSTFDFDDLSISVSETSTSEVTEVCLSPDP